MRRSVAYSTYDDSLRPARRARQAGLSLLEIVVVLNVLGVAFLGISSLFANNRRSFAQMNERAIAMREATAVLDSMRDAGFMSVHPTFDGFTFTVDEIGGTGTVTLLADETATGQDPSELGLPRDLDGDGLATNVDVSACYRLLPVVVQVEWPGPGGLNRLTLYQLLAEE